MNKEFKYKEFDQEGLETLKVIEKSDHFNGWMFDRIAPFLKGKVLEVGSGIGNISAQVLKHDLQLTLSDIRENYCAELKEKFGGKKNVEGVIHLDLVHPEFEFQYKDLIGKFDSVFALNVVEHIENDELAIINAAKLLKVNGNLVILVPAFMSLYNKFDKELFHYRRYIKSGLILPFKKAGLEIRHSSYFNCVGTLGWFVSGSIFKKKIIPASQMALFNKLVPFIRVFDTLLFRSVGLSVIVAGQKKPNNR